LAEEAIRLYGLDKITPHPSSNQLASQLPEHNQWREAARDTLVEAGLIETYNYSFEHEPTLKKLNIKTDPSHRLEINNPHSQEQRYLRTSLLPRLIQNTLTNKQLFRQSNKDTEKALFEISHVFMPIELSHTRVDGVKEEDRIAGLVVGQPASLLLVQGILDNIFSLFDIDHVQYSKKNIIPFGADDTHEISYQDKPLGLMGSLSKSTQFYQQTQLNMTMFEINLDALIEITEKTPDPIRPKEIEPQQYQKPGKYPASYRDLSVLINPEVSIDAIQSIIETIGGPIVKDSDLIDVYEPENLSEETSPRRSLTFHITYQSQDHTLTDKEINSAHNDIIARLKSEFDAELRE
jgi:phenylalanyl-tRNA synthetase beta chain